MALIDTSVDDREAYFGALCEEKPYATIGDPNTPALSRSACIDQRLTEQAHNACVIYASSTSTFALNAMTLDERTAY